MNLIDRLKEISQTHGLGESTVLQVRLTGGKQIRGRYRACVAAQDNDPEFAQLDLYDLESGDLVGLLETEIDRVIVITQAEE